MKELMIAVPIVLVLMMPFAFPAQGQPSFQRFNDTSKLVKSGLSPFETNGNYKDLWFLQRTDSAGSGRLYCILQGYK